MAPGTPSIRRSAAVVMTAAAFMAAAGAAEVAAQDAVLQVGDEAPAFPAPLPSTAGERPGARTISLDEVIGQKNIVLAFYVADWTGG